MYIVTGHGQSGTKWLAKVLGCEHEPLKLDAMWAKRTEGDPTIAKEWAEWRVPKMQEPWGEVNSYLRLCATELMFLLPDMTVAGLVRDGRFVVRSMAARGVHERLHGPWSDFEKLCRYWAQSHYWLADVKEWFRLEDLNEDWNEVERLGELLGVDVPREHWEGLRNVRVGKNVETDTVPQWDRKMCRAFARSAGTVQTHFGYPLPRPA